MWAKQFRNRFRISTLYLRGLQNAPQRAEKPKEEKEALLTILRDAGKDLNENESQELSDLVLSVEDGIWQTDDTRSLVSALGKAKSKSRGDQNTKSKRRGKCLGDRRYLDRASCHQAKAVRGSG